MVIALRTGNQEQFNCSNPTLAWKDPSDHKTVTTMYVLAGINALVIAQGIYTFILRLRNDNRITRNKTIAFYVMALSCLIVAEVYFLSYKIDTTMCSQSFLQSYPAFAYLVVGYTYIYKSLEVINVNDTCRAESIKDKKGL